MTTPCVNLCVLDVKTGLCAGCGRTMAEIVAWSSLNEAERRAIAAGLSDRLAAAAGAAPTPDGRASRRPLA